MPQAGLRSRSQKKNLRANWISRGLVPDAVLVMEPKLALFRMQHVVLGGANCVRLNKLKNSTRDSTPARPSAPKTIFLKIAKSKLFTPSERRVASTRGSSPKVKSAGATKHAVLNQSPRLKGLVRNAFLHPGTIFGREPAPNRVASLACPLLKTRGNPR